MGRPRRKTQQQPKGPMQRYLDRKEAEAANNPLVSESARNHGDYGETTISVTAGELDGEGHGQKRVTVNRGGSTLLRWLHAGSLTPSQADAIGLYSRCWRRVFSEPKVTATVSPVAFIRSTGDEARHNALLIDAEETLKFLDERIFDLAPDYYRSVWQDVVIFNRRGDYNRQSADREKTICLFIADMIATALRL